MVGGWYYLSSSWCSLGGLAGLKIYILVKILPRMRFSVRVHLLII